jgi:hypothetical protein
MAWLEEAVKFRAVAGRAGHGVPVQGSWAGHGARPAGDGGSGTAAGFQIAGEALGFASRPPREAGDGDANRGPVRGIARRRRNGVAERRAG